MNKTIFLFLSMLAIFWSSLVAQEHNGLVGLLFDDVNLTRMSSILYLESANSEETTWPDKHDFSVKWIGYITPAISGEVTFYGEADNEMQLVINGSIVVNTWGDADQAMGRLTLNKNRTYPVQLLYRQINGSSYLRIYWSWEGQQKIIIPSMALSYDDKNESEIFKSFRSQVNIDLSQLNFDVSSIIEIHKPDDVLQKRNAVNQWLWGSEGFPSGKLPANVIKDYSDSNFASLKNLKRIDKLVINMDFGLNSIVYHFIADESNGSAVLYHQGHRGKFSLGNRTVNAFLESGYDVFAFSMPLLGMNNKPVVNFRRFGKMIIHAHNQMSYLKPDQGHPVKYFMEPVAATVNYTEGFHYQNLIMIGISGGGWTTTLYSAIDPRINISYPVAGTLPNYLRARDLNGSGSLGDYEQRVPGLYRTANYLELYIMGAYGPGRKQLQILNEFDSCCFRGTGFKSYINTVKERVNSLGAGHYDVFLDSTHRLHQISQKALEIIFQDLKKWQE